METCSVRGCENKKHAKGFCQFHYRRFWATGSTEVKRPCLRGTVEERFWNHVKKGKKNECWEWEGFTDKDGYGKMRTEGTNEGVHRVSFRIHGGNIPKGMKVLHKCNNPPCCNPNHLYCGNQTQNMQDRIKAGNFKYGQDHHNSVISDETVKMIKEDTGTYKFLAEKYGCSASQVGNIKRGSQRINK